jgi:hypothetical protein
MTPEAALIELLARVGAGTGAEVLVSAEEMGHWPPVAVATMKAQRVLTRARPAVSVVCPGCEQQCVMAVQTQRDGLRRLSSFVVCDKRSDINRVPVPVGNLEQWQASGAAIADLVARLLDVRRPSGDEAKAGRWEIGMFRGAKHSSHLVLLRDRELTLSLAGHSIALVDLLEMKGDRLAIDRRMLMRCVDHPVAGAGDAESAAERRARIKARVRAEKARGTKAFLKVVAQEESISVTRLKQLARDEPAADEPQVRSSRESPRPTPGVRKVKR